MNNSLFVLLLLAVLLIPSRVYPQKFPYLEYEPRTISELVEMDAGTPYERKEKGVIVHGKAYYSAIRVKYIGTSRPISAEKKIVFNLWRSAMQVDERVMATLENEYLFKECDKEYWVAVQKQVAAFFPKELKPGDMITLYLMAVGAARAGDKWTRFF